VRTIGLPAAVAVGRGPEAGRQDRDLHRSCRLSSYIGGGHGVFGADARGQHAWTFLLALTLTMVVLLVSCAAVVSPAVPIQ
jgi:hypothetical protein